MGYLFAVLRGLGDIFIIFMSYSICLALSSGSIDSPRKNIWKYIGIVVVAFIVVAQYRGLDVYDKIEMFTKICVPGLFGVYAGLKEKEQKSREE